MALVQKMHLSSQCCPLSVGGSVVNLLFYVSPIVCWGSVFVFVWYALLYAHSSFVVILTRKIAFIVFRMSCYCKCSVALPHGACRGLVFSL